MRIEFQMLHLESPINDLESWIDDLELPITDWDLLFQNSLLAVDDINIYPVIVTNNVFDVILTITQIK